jgi:threonine dehydrogenase-like Zn-dependent dehydrogenase
MQRAAWNSDRTLSVHDEQARAPGEGEVRVQVVNAGICGSDLHWYRGDFEPTAMRTPGHEIGGIVSAIGPGVSHVQEGDVVGVEPLLRCGNCGHCNSGHYNQCQVAGGLIGIAVDGGIAQHVFAPGAAVFKAPQGIDGEVAAMAEPLACGVHGYNMATLGQDETVLVIGAGTIGLTAQLAAQAAGANVIVLARHPHQQEAARNLGAAEVIGEDEAGRQRLEELTRDDAIDVVAECVGGHADTIRQSVDVVRRLGRVIVLGVFAIDNAGFNPLTLLGKEITMIGAVTYGKLGGRVADYQQALDVLTGCAEEARSLITHRYTLNDVNTAFDTALDKGSKSIKVHITPNG